MGGLRQSNGIDLAAAQNLLEANGHARALGTPLNTLVTIHWGLADGGGDARKRFARLQEKARKWLQARGATLTSVFVHESALSPEIHTHWAIHVRRGLGPSFDRMLRRWIGGDVDLRVCNVTPIKNDGAINYMLKDLQPIDYARLNLPRKLAKKRSDRPLVGKRIGTSQNLGLKARAAWAAQAREAGHMMYVHEPALKQLGTPGQAA